MRLFKSTYRDRRGRKRETDKWYCEFRDHRETIRRIPTFTSKSAATETGRNLEKLVGYHRSSGGQTDPALTVWLENLPQRIRTKLAAIGLLDARQVAAAKPLSEHVQDFTESLRAKGCSSTHVGIVTARVRRIVGGCEFRFWSDISPSRIMTYLHELRTDCPPKKGIGAQTFNFHLGAIKQFARWMVADRRVSESPLGHLKGLNVKADLRRARRALTADELHALLEATRGGPDRAGMAGAERATLYWLAVETGLRAGELRSLVRSSFDLRGDEPTVTVAASYSKRRREDILPLRPALTEHLRVHLAKLTPTATVFCMPNRARMAAAFRADLEAAGMPYRDDADRVADFHALRHTFISNLAAGGVHPKTAQSLARHSTIMLTMDRYTHTYGGELAAALTVLPNLTPSGRERVRATGTEDTRPSDNVSADCLALHEELTGSSVDSGGREGPHSRDAETLETKAKTGSLHRRGRDSPPLPIRASWGNHSADAQGLTAQRVTCPPHGSRAL